MGPFGMPSETTMVVTIASLHILHFINFPLGILLLIVASFSDVILGPIILSFLLSASSRSSFSHDQKPKGLVSCGQVLSAIAIGLGLHIYLVSTPLVLRFVLISFLLDEM